MNAKRDFSPATLKALKARGITVGYSAAAPAFEGDVYFSGVIYALNDNGVCRMRTFQQVLAIAVGGAI